MVSFAFTLAHTHARGCHWTCALHMRSIFLDFVSPSFFGRRRSTNRYNTIQTYYSTGYVKTPSSGQSPMSAINAMPNANVMKYGAPAEIELSVFFFRCWTISFSSSSRCGYSETNSRNRTATDVSEPSSDHVSEISPEQTYRFCHARLRRHNLFTGSISIAHKKMSTRVDRVHNLDAPPRLCAKCQL